MNNIFDNMNQLDMDLLVVLSQIKPSKNIKNLAQRLMADKMKIDCYLNGHPNAVAEGVSKNSLFRKMYCPDCNTFYEE